MKKIIALLLCLAMVLAFAGCGSNGGNNSADGKKLKVGFIYLHDENSTYDLNFINAAKAACEKMEMILFSTFPAT